MKIFIKNMVCQGTRKFVMMEIKKLGLKLESFESGELEFSQELSPVETFALERSLNRYGLEMKLHSDFSGSIKYFDPYEDLIGNGISERGSRHMTELTKAV